MTRRGVFLVLLLSITNRQQVKCLLEEDVVQNVTTKVQIEGCNECADYRCPDDPSKCLLGSVPDPCECCAAGICARLDGDSCWNASIPELLPKSRNEGFCARNYLCQLRPDLHEEDETEAVCVCMEQSPACGSNNETYATPCALHERAMRLKNSSLKLQHLGPCPTRPWILTGPRDVVSTSGQRVALNCEVKGFPVPDISWEFDSTLGDMVLKLPSKEHEGFVNTNDGPEPLMKSSWMQLVRMEQRLVGTYRCIANNTMGEASAAAFVSML